MNRNPGQQAVKRKPIFRTIREQIADTLRDEVLSGQLAPGEHLLETELASRFGVSRGPVRDALLQLTQERMLIYRPNCGVEVATGPSETIRALVVPVRRMVEGYALRLAAARADQAAIARWKQILEQLRLAGEAGDLSAVVAHDMAFHRWIIETAGEPDLLAIWLPIITRMRLGYSRHRDLRDVYPEHVKIFEPFRKGKIEAAVQALEANIV
jgi:DNA-binding GntR family transcriptional regulator